MTAADTESLTIEGTIEGVVWADGLDVTIALNAMVIGDISARQITVLGTVCGTLEASERVDMRQGSRVMGRVVTRTLVLADGAWFTGTSSR
jgi:cytoskeletal protein CcmA (bactofilin family)